VTDKVKFTDVMTVEQMPFLTIDPDQSLSVSGILGLSPKDDSAGPLFVEQLVELDQISVP